METVLRCRQCGTYPGTDETTACATCGNTDWQAVLIDPASPPDPDDPVVPA